ncbi:hypothetical protein CcaverHIS002_0502050 [Cutaneotrichosporon cavernicola]|nr:hypothetical protein CcaverHIS002_0502050 [Cutaneotrichosporon cavernicola]BEJ00410.1 hypothetical protein CcaverHIS631_0502670 [Cutaneotrichosporon cavernicola]BEJ08180.1 hypothetical protein CcaverHIS641_0502650 [Cutaneotrichosporon cavernicola]
MSKIRHTIQIDNGPVHLIEVPALSHDNWPNLLRDFPSPTAPDFVTSATEWATRSAVRERVLLEALEWSVVQSHLANDPDAYYHDPSMVGIVSALKSAEIIILQQLGVGIEVIDDDNADGNVNSSAEADISTESENSDNDQGSSQSPPTPPATHLSPRPRSVSGKSKSLSTEPHTLSEVPLSILTVTEKDNKDKGKGKSPPTAQSNAPQLLGHRSESAQVEINKAEDHKVTLEQEPKKNVTRRVTRSQVNAESSQNIANVGPRRSARQANAQNSAATNHLSVPKTETADCSSPRLRDMTAKAKK